MNAVIRFKAIINKASSVLPVSLCFFMLIACTPGEEQRVFRLEGRTMGTSYHITAVAGRDVSLGESALQIEVDKLLENINEVMSTYIADSEISMLNQSALNSPTVVSQQLFDILTLSQRISVFTDGAFDITVGPLVNVWGFGPKEKDERAPSDEEIINLLATVGYQNLELDAQRLQVVRRKAIYLDLSAIAKGYGADRVADFFSEKGIHNYMIELGGELAIAGNNPKGEAWKIGIEQPSLAQTGVMQAIAIGSGGVATSGDYRNYYEVDGKRFSHTIDPSTGRPITHTLASTTLVAETAAEADALATALNVMGPEEGYSFAVNNGLAAYFIIRHEDGFVTKSSPEFKKYRVKL